MYDYTYSLVVAVAHLLLSQLLLLLLLLHLGHQCGTPTALVVQCYLVHLQYALLLVCCCLGVGTSCQLCNCEHPHHHSHRTHPPPVQFLHSS